MKRAIVFGGGGSRGAYEMGAWRALREMEQHFDIAVGTSIGSINAALYAQGAFEMTQELWANMSVDQIMADGINLDANLETFYAQRGNLLAFLKTYALNHGADVTPLLNLLKRVIDEKRVRASDIRYGLVTVRFPSLAPVEYTIADIPEGRLVDYLMASAAIFPAFPMYKIDGALYIDGGYYDTLPVNLALRMGAEDVVVIDLMEKPTHPELFRRPWARYIRRSQSLGSVLNFEPDNLKRCDRLGYLDTLRAFDKVMGVKYSLDTEDVRGYADAARRFSLNVARIEASLAFANAITRALARAPLTDILDKETPLNAPPDTLKDFVCGAEICATILEIEPTERYSVQTLRQAIMAKLPLADANTLCILAEREEYEELLSNMGKAGPKLTMACLLTLMKQNRLEKVLGRVLPENAQELIGACFLNEF